MCLCYELQEHSSKKNYESVILIYIVYVTLENTDVGQTEVSTDSHISSGYTDQLQQSPLTRKAS